MVFAHPRCHDAPDRAASVFGQGWLSNLNILVLATNIVGPAASFPFQH